MEFARKIGSLPVANVQELAGTYCGGGSDKIPDRYIRPEINGDDASGGGVDSSEAIPVIDLGRLLHGPWSQEESAKLSSACKEWGFFLLINHGVPSEVIDGFKRDVIKFFEQPLEDKKAYAQLPNSIEGYGQAFVVSEDQILDWSDMFALILRPNSHRNMSLWPTYPSTFRDSIERYSSETAKVSLLLMEFMAKDLGVGPEQMLDAYKEERQVMRMNYYPPCPAAHQVLGLSPHSDASGVTLLLQVNDVAGLQIKRGGGWLAVEALPGAFVVNIGDILEIMSNGIYKSIEHRAVVNREGERISVATFLSPHQHSTISPLPELVRGGEGALYRSTSYQDYMKSIYSARLDGKSQLETMKLS